MTYFADLTDYPVARLSNRPLKAVGWPGEEPDFESGGVPREFVDALGKLVVGGTVRRTRGLYRCRLCNDPPWLVEEPHRLARWWMVRCEPLGVLRYGCRGTRETSQAPTCSTTM